MKPTVVIAAAGPPRPQVLALSSQIKSAAMVPINGKPVLGWILDEFFRDDFQHFQILIPEGDTHLTRYVKSRFRPQAVDLRFVETEKPDLPRGLGHTLLEGLSAGIRTPDVLLVLGHTILLKQDLEFDEDWVMYGEVSEEMTRWCYVRRDAERYLTELVDKPEEDWPLPNSALIGLYYFRDAALLLRSLQENHPGAGEPYQLSPALQAYSHVAKVRVIPVPPASTWLDCGSNTGLHRSRRKLIATRSHNEITVDEDVGVLTKRSEHSADLHQQYSWYLSLPKDLMGLVPRVVDFEPPRSRGEKAVMSLEYYGYHSLEEAWVYQELKRDVWHSILEHLLKVMERFWQYKATISRDDFNLIYRTKTRARLAQLLARRSEINWGKLLSYATLRINGSPLQGWPNLEAAIEKRIDLLYVEDHITIIHGDFHFANILYELDTRLVKLIDPRGSFGSSGIFGDCKYDLAKLRHSISGGYNYIVNDLFHVTCSDNRIDVEIPKTSEQQLVAQWFDREVGNRGFDVESVQFIEGLLFLSMLPIHRDKPDRQLAMFARAMERLNQVLSPAAAH